MRLVLCLLGIYFSIIGTSLAEESGDCDGLENIAGRNKLFNNSIEVDPCEPVKVQKCLKKVDDDDDDDKCTTVASKRFPLRLLASEFNSTVNGIKVNMVLQLNLEFFIEAHLTDEDGNYDIKSKERLGFFEDLVFEDCNSYACCNPKHKSRRNTVRRCPTASTGALTALPGNSGFYSIAYLWHPPHRSFHGNVIFVGSFVQSQSVHWENVKTDVIRVDTKDGDKTTSSKTSGEKKSSAESESKSQGKKKSKDSTKPSLFSSGGDGTKTSNDEDVKPSLFSSKKTKETKTPKEGRTTSSLFSSSKKHSSTEVNSKPLFSSDGNKTAKSSGGKDSQTTSKKTKVTIREDDERLQNDDSYSGTSAQTSQTRFSNYQSRTGIIILRELADLILPL